MNAVITADEVLQAKFRSAKFREGYDQDEVDAFLDRVVATLRAREGGAAAPQPVTPGDVDDVRFARTKFREGYDIEDVDDLLARVHEALGVAPSSAGSRPAAAPGEPVPVPGLGAVKGFWRRLFGG